MPSLSVGTNWTFQGRIINRSTLISVPATYRVTVSAADTQNTKYQTWWGTNTVDNLSQQAVKITVVRSGTNVTPATTVYSGLFQQNAEAAVYDLGYNFSAPYTGQAILRDSAGNNLLLWVTTNANYCNGIQSALMQVNYTDSYSTFTGTNCRN